MKPILKILSLLLAFATLFAFADGDDPDRSRLVLKITRPSPDHTIITTNRSIRLAGFTRPAGVADSVKFVTSTGQYGPCALISNTIWHTPRIRLVPGHQNFITVVGIDTNTHRAATDYVHVLRITPGVVSNRPPRITSRPHRLWGTNRVYRYVLAARDPEHDHLRLVLKKHGPVETTIHKLDEGKWLISALLTRKTRRVRFKAYVYDPFNRPVRQSWSVYLPPERTEAPATEPEID